LIREWAERRLSSLGGKIIEFRTPKTSLRPRRSSQWHAEKGQAAIVSFVYESGTLDIRVPLSPVPHLLTSNLTPSDSETQLVKRTIQQAEHEISRVVALSRSHSLRRLSNFMTAVNDALSRLEDVISKHRAVLSPIRRLPYEIIEHILLFSPDRDMDFQFERWKWTHICRRWRVVAIGAPELWANLRTIVACPNSRKGLDKIEMQIARAKHLPIHFHFSAYLKDLPSTHPVIQLLVRHSERWGNVYFSTTSTTLNSFSKVRGRLPQLRTLGLAIWRCQDQDRIDLFSFAPQLTSVTILGTYEHPIPLPPTSLSYLSHRYTTSATLNTFFSQADTLQSLELLWTVNTFNDYPVTFPRLASLKVSYGGAGSGGFLNNITTPALHTLMIDGRAYSADVLSSVHDLIRRSMITSILKTIGFYGRSLQSLDITPLLQTLPNIETFKGMLPSKQDLASFVAFSSSDMRFLPRLQSLLFIPFFDQLDSEMITLINAVAYSRSTAGLAFRTAEARVLPLKDFCVTVTGTGPFDECTKAMARLEGWDHTEESVYMASLRDSLSEALPVAKRRTNEVRHFRDSLKLRSAQAIDKLMTSIEKCSVTRAEDLLVSLVKHSFSLSRLTCIY